VRDWGVVAHEDVRAALDRILAGAGFRNADRLSRFLRFVVEQSLAGGAAELKEYRLGTEVYDRGADFDPRVDPIVRVEARRLRTKLLEYYEGPGSADPVRITMPKGGYAPVFERAAAVVAVPGRRNWVWLAVVAVGIAAAVVTFGSRVSSEAVSMVVIPASAEADREFADGLAEAVSVELSRSPRVQVVAWPMFVEYRRQQGGTLTTAVRQTAQDLRAGTVLFVSVRRSGERRRISGHLMNPEQGWKRWAGEYERGLDAGFAAQREVARAIADEVLNGLMRRP
jgi:TolB-like protein